MKQKRITLLFLLFANICGVSAQKWYTPDIDQKVEVPPAERFVLKV